MNNTLKAEFRKLIAQRGTWWLLLAAVLFGLLNTISAFYSVKLNAVPGLPPLDTPEGALNVYANAPGAYLFSMILGSLIVTGEFRHGTAIATFLAQPKRTVVLVAKLAVGAIAGLIVQLIVTITSIAAVFPFMQSVNAATLESSDMLRITWAGILSGVVLGVVGVGVGSLIRNQVITVVGSIIWLLLVEGMLIAFFSGIGKWLMTGAIAGILDVSYESGPISFGKDALSPTAATFLLLAYAMAFAVIGAVTTLRRDID
jgi:ABC-2 type transport system permease protein